MISKEHCKATVIPFQFRQIVYNLFSNSLKFSHSEIPLRIKIKSSLVNGSETSHKKLLSNFTYCHFSFEDNGIGFEPEYNEKVFDIFQRLHEKAKYKGTGIGLAIVKKIIENHNGIILAHGKLNKGVSFDIFIPQGYR